MVDICFDEIRKAVGNKLSDDEIAGIVDDVTAKIDAKRKWRKGSIDDAQLYKEAAAEAITDRVHDSIGNLRDKVLKNKREAKYIDESVNFKDHFEGLKNKYIKTDTKGKAYSDGFFGGLISDLEKANLFDIVKKGKIGRAIAKEMWEEGSTNNPYAKQIAKIFRKWQDVIVERQNTAGALIKKIEGYIIKQTHDSSKIRKNGYEQWASFIKDKLDLEKTFGEIDPDEFLRTVYDDIITGRQFQISDDPLKVPPLQGDIVKRVSAKRKLHFKDADSFWDYNLKYGSGEDILSSVGYAVERAGKNIALLEELGPSPRTFHNDMIRFAKQEYHGRPELYDKMTGRYAKKLENYISDLDGTINMPGDYFTSKVGSVIRSIQNMSALGQITLSAIPDVVYSANQMSRHGMSLLNGYLTALKSLIGKQLIGRQREIARLIGVGIEGTRGTVLARFTGFDNLSGQMSRLQETFFKMTGMNWWNDSLKQGVGLMFSNQLGEARGLNFRELHPRFIDRLGEHGINELKWNFIRQIAEQAEDGNWYVSPDRISDLDDNLFSDLFPKKKGDQLARSIRDFKLDLEANIRTYIIDSVDKAIITPDIQERVALNMGTQRGTIPGEAIRFVMQFKSYPLAVINKVISPLVKEKDIFGLAHVILGTTILGYVAQSAKELAKGRTPREINPGTEEGRKAWLAALLQGGGLGIYGDFLLGTRSRFGQGPLETAMGPTFSDANQLFKILEKARSGEIADTGAMSFQFIKNNTPFINLFYTRTALDYLLLYNIQEKLNPGYLRRMERRIKKENNQTFLFPPSKYALGVK